MLGLVCGPHTPMALPSSASSNCLHPVCRFDSFGGNRLHGPQDTAGLADSLSFVEELVEAEVRRLLAGCFSQTCDPSLL
jgi:hypothetical protein